MALGAAKGAAGLGGTRPAVAIMCLSKLAQAESALTLSLASRPSRESRRVAASSRASMVKVAGRVENCAAGCVGGAFVAAGCGESRAGTSQPLRLQRSIITHQPGQTRTIGKYRVTWTGGGKCRGADPA